MTQLLASRRRLLLAPLLAALPLGLAAGRAQAINPAETQVFLPDQIKWTAWTAGPPHRPKWLCCSAASTRPENTSC